MSKSNKDQYEKYDQDYYDNYLPGLPYVKNEHWEKFFDNIAKEIKNKINPKTVLDVGCAKGFLVEKLRNRGIEAHGIDISEYAISQVDKSVKDYCKVGSILEKFDRKYDLIICIEVVEHLFIEDSKVAINNLCDYSDDIIFSSSPDGFEEKTHHNVQNPSYWASLFAKKNLFRDTKFDATFITTWSGRFKKNTKSINLILENYEDKLWETNHEKQKLMEEMNHEKQKLMEKINDMHEIEIEHQQEFEALKNSLPYNIGNYIIESYAKYVPENNIFGKMIRKILEKIYVNRLAPYIKQKQMLISQYVFDDFIDEKLVEQQIKDLEFKPKISIIMPVYNSNIEFLEKAIDSVKKQYYSNWQLCICDDASTKTEIQKILKKFAANDERICVTYSEKNQGIGLASNTALEMTEGEFTVLLDHDDMLSKDALFEIIKTINTDKSVDYIYSDEDKIDEKGFHVEPFFKPDWSPNMFFSHNYPIHVSVFQTSKLKEIKGFRKGFDGSQDYDLILRYLEQSKKIKHIPKILYSWRKSQGSTALKLSEKDYAFDVGIKAISDALVRRKIDAVCSKGIQKGTYHVQYKIKDSPVISIIIPTKNLENLKKCMKSIFKKSTYQNFEIIVLDTSSENKIEEFCNTSKVQHLSIPLKKFNFSKINNEGVKRSKGKYIIFLNDDTEVISPEWIEALLEHAQRDEVGIVGSKLLYRNKLVQHAGTIIGINKHAGNYGNMHNDEPGYFSYPKIVRDCSAVTAACMMISKELFEKCNGFDENLANSWQDVDLCLRVSELNKEIIFTPYSLLYHYEGNTRGRVDASENEMEARRIFREKHKEFILKGDPHYNPNLSNTIPFALKPKLTKTKK